MVTCPGTRVSDSVLLIVGSGERHLCRLHTARSALAALPPSLCAASRSGLLVPCAHLSSRRLSPAQHSRHSCTGESLASGSNLAPPGRSLALVVRYGLSTLSFRSSLCQDTPFSSVELPALPVWLVLCLTPCLESFHAPSGPPLLLSAPNFLSAAAKSRNISLLPHGGPYRPQPPVARGRLSLLLSPPPLLLSS